MSTTGKSIYAWSGQILERNTHRLSRLIRQGINTVEDLINYGISEETARMALEAMLQPV